MGGIAPLALSAEHIWEILTECWIVPGLPWAGGFWFEVWDQFRVWVESINLQSEMFAILKSLMFCVRFVFHKYFPKNLNIIITKPFYSGAKRMNNFSIAQFPFVKVLTSWQIHQILLRSWQFLRNHCKLLQFSITTWSDQEVAFLFQNTLWVFEYYDGVIFLVAHCMRQNTSKNVSMFEMFEMSANLCLLNFVTTSFRERGTLVMRNLTGTKR